ncbi:MAG: TonB family protein, partial [Vicinamibacteria bacterium]
IKPSNVIVFAGEKVKVTDFGIAKLMDADATHSGLMLGTPSYMSPEQAMGEDLDGSTDLFSLGVVAFEMLSGMQPFPGNNVTSILYKLVHSDPVQPDNLEVLGLLPDKWHEVFSRVLAKTPSERYPNAAAFVQDLELCLGSWFGALEGETLIIRDPPLPSSTASGKPPSRAVPGSDETVAVKPEVFLQRADGEETLVVPEPDETRTAAAPGGAFDSLPPPVPVTAPLDVDETIAAPASAIERTLYSGPGVEATEAHSGDETLLAPPPVRPAVTVAIRKFGPLKSFLVPLGAGALVLAGLLAFLVARGGEDPLPVAPIPDPVPPVAVAPTGSLLVATEPDGARVLVNGEERGLTPVELEALPLGGYQIRIEREGFEPEVLQAALTAEAPRAALDVALRPAPKPPPAAPRPAYFRIRSTPPGGRVAVDGREIGSTPLDRVQVAPGARVVRILQEGFLPWEDTFRARAGRTEPIDAILTERPPSAPETAPLEEEPSESEAPMSVAVGSLVERGEPGVVNPKCDHCPGVPYPEPARRNRLEGVVELGFLIDENGDVQDLQILKSGGDVFDDAVLETVKSWRYEPATKHGVRVKMRWVQRFRFQQGR